MDLPVDLDARADRASAIYRALLEAIRAGRVGAGDRLPPTRTLARDLGVARNTVATAYERLAAEGLLDARVGAGTYVTDLAAPVPAPRRPGSLHPRAGWSFRPLPVSGEQPAPPYDFRVGIPDASLFPFDTWRRLVAAELRAGAHRPGTYAHPAGLPQLRAAIVRYLALARGVAAEADDVVVTHGTQQALDLVARVLLEPGDVVAVEDPGYPFARELFASHGARVVPVPVDAEGLVVERVPERARLVFSTPSHQFPLGPPLSLARRQALLELANRHRVAIVEDDYDSEFRFTDRPLETLHAMDRHGRVVYVGTFSKSLLPALRAGYLVAPEPLREALLGARQLADGHGGPAEQAALAHFVADGLLARHLRRARATYAERRELVRSGLERLLADRLEVVPSAAGLHVAATFRDAEVDDAAVAEAALAAGVAVEPLSAYAVGPDVPPGLVLGYGAAGTATIRPGLERLARLVASTPSRPPRPRRPGAAAAGSAR
ncbi:MULTISPECIES: PLP-dependent aminotransferase family protein [unclassified Nocardioides]|uniref:MocR-like pyridoxine biosynthesis transcription factor PdxR n=1 Tax=unclassified Nocardioides TaxID=2615069 RepID=UPI0000570D58|nr:MULTISPECIES: PLP-dependent aminotransferase family protein [unclassified Nocardioides]ABL81201.1 transcriptional regulator, GntR family [Nocardioides sp. JS614]